MTRLLGKRIAEGIVGNSLPTIDTINLMRQVSADGIRYLLNRPLYLVQGDDERRLLVPEETKGFQGLGFQSMHDIDDENSDITQR